MIDCIYLPTPPYEQDAKQGQFFMQHLTGFNSEFSFLKLVPIPRLKSTVYLTIQPIAGGRIVGFIPFPKGISIVNRLVQDLNLSCWVHFHNGNHYTTTSTRDLAKAWITIDRLLVIWKSDLTNKRKHSFFQAAVVLIHGR